jgi:hypothetical protein
VAEPKTGLAICLIHLIIPLGLEEMYRKITAAFKPGWYKGLPDGPYIGDDDEQTTSLLIPYKIRFYPFFVGFPSFDSTCKVLSDNPSYND